MRSQMQNHRMCCCLNIFKNMQTQQKDKKKVNCQTYKIVSLHIYLRIYGSRQHVKPRKTYLRIYGSRKQFKPCKAYAGMNCTKMKKFS